MKRTSTRSSATHNDYRCSIERNQTGKYCIRIQVQYPRHAWTLGVFFLASSFDRAMKKLEQSLDFLQRHEEKLWFWGVDRAADLGGPEVVLKIAAAQVAVGDLDAARATARSTARRRSRRSRISPGASCVASAPISSWRSRAEWRSIIGSS